MLKTPLPVRLDAPSVANAENAYLQKTQSVLRATKLVVLNVND